MGCTVDLVSYFALVFSDVGIIQGASLAIDHFISVLSDLNILNIIHIPISKNIIKPYWILLIYSSRQPPLVRFWKNPSGSYRSRVSSAYCFDSLLMRPQ